MPIDRADIDIYSDASTELLQDIIASAAAGGPFRLTDVTRLDGTRAVLRCHFQLARPGLVVGFRSLVELQHRLADMVEIVGVHRGDLTVAA